jgi:transposase
VALGRKNSSSLQPRVRRDLAWLYSLIATCDLHDVDPIEYRKDVLLRVDVHPADIEAILPHRWTPPTRVAIDDIT